MRRIGVTVAVAALWLTAAQVVAAPPASAHSVAGVTGTNYRTELKAVTPQVPGLKFRVIETGSRMELDNKTGQEAVVLGYQDEPYLRVGPAGVFENTRSAATYLNASRRGTTPVPSTASPTAAPEWRKVSSGTTARWHDHRTHWMGTQDPPIVRRAPGRVHVVVPEWLVQVRMADATMVAVTGDLVWVPAPSAAPWLALAVVLLGLSVLAGLSGSWAGLLLVVLAAAVAVDVVHEVGIGFANAGSLPVQLGRVVLGSFFSVVAWVVAAIGMRQLARRSGDGLLMAAFAGVVIGLFGGVGDLPALFSSQVPFAWSAGLARALTAASLGLGFGLLGGAVVAIVRHRVFEVPEGEESEGEVSEGEAGSADDAAPAAARSTE
ncbi:MAG TPA: hypothetical protein VGO92_00990 [Acidimicrobiales bacterium]|nr:hypothetical protein [Acidimicrobiales bacterium]